MKIGIDLDGVVVDLVSPLLEHHNDKHGTNFVYQDIVEHDFWNPLGLSREEGERRLIEFMQETDFDVIKPQLGAIEAVKKLSEDHELFVVTSRPELYTKKTFEWINHHLPNIFKKIVFTYQYPAIKGIVRKEEICRDESIDIMIEDFDRNLLGCARVCKKVLLFDQR
jgi:uncharacterized HAD superfamily protein